LFTILLLQVKTNTPRQSLNILGKGSKRENTHIINNATPNNTTRHFTRTRQNSTCSHHRLSDTTEAAVIVSCISLRINPGLIDKERKNMVTSCDLVILGLSNAMLEFQQNNQNKNNRYLSREKYQLSHQDGCDCK
jgi:hypothetical protein